MNNITKFLESQNDFENDQINFLFHNLFSEIKKIARVQLNKFPISHDMSPTVLVNECYLKLITAKSLSLNNTKHFYCIISQCMR
ncbi:MAG: ECF-type sigma factor, partial [Marinicella sp.]